MAITFTKKAAAELKGRIRRQISELRATSSAEDDKVHDSRVKYDGDIEMLLSLIDDAPISTIDSFLQKLSRPYLDTLCERPPSDNLDEGESMLLRGEAVRAAWRLQTGIDGVEAGLRGDIEAFLQSRNRLATRLGGQSKASTVISSMLNRSLFVAEAQRKVMQGGRLDSESSLFEIVFTNNLEHLINEYFQQFVYLIGEWVDCWCECGGALISDSSEGQTRFRYVQSLLTQAEVQTDIEKLQWIGLVCHALIPKSNWNKVECKPIGNGTPPNNLDWSSGVLGRSSWSIDAEVKSMILNKLDDITSSIQSLVENKEMFVLRTFGWSAHIFHKFFSPPIPQGEKCKPHPDIIAIEELEKGNNTGNASSDLELQFIEDLFRVHDGARQILNRLKEDRGLSDFDDIYRYAEALLLSRCPDVCRDDYPSNVVDALDSIGDDCWSDTHIQHALELAKDNPKVFIDLKERYQRLKNIRREFRAFIIDEFQDTNPQQFRLLCRLWGRRHLEPDEPISPQSGWDPTVCVVGDMKQSIYRFRQADVTVMLDAVQAIRRMNSLEADSESRLSQLIRPDAAVDPRVVDPNEIGFVKGTEFHQQNRDRWVSFALDDDGSNLGHEAIQSRMEGHIQMRTNYRTLPTLVDFMNGVFDDSFGPRNRLIDGRWHASAQRLIAGRKDSPKTGGLEWIIPSGRGDEQAPLDLAIPLDPYSHRDKNLKSLYADLLARRLAALFTGGRSNCGVGSNAVHVTESNEIRPEDVMILVHSRKNIPLIIRILESYGIPAMADKQGILLHRPVNRPMMALLWWLSNQKSKSAALALARSEIIALDDSQILRFLTSKEDAYTSLFNSIGNTKVQNLFARISKLGALGKSNQAIREVIEHSDLLYAHPRESDRQDVENWYTLYNSLTVSLGDDPGLIYSRMKELKDLGSNGPASTNESSTRAVQVMTIHASKGLEANIVVLFDMFTAGEFATQFSKNDNCIVTSDLLSGRIDLWNQNSKIEGGLWQIMSQLDDSQVNAELARTFYVALTRARDRLILVGKPKGGAWLDDSDLIICRGNARLNMGYMLLDGIKSISSKYNGNDSVWVDVKHKSCKTSAYKINLSHTAIQAQLGPSGPKSLYMFHGPVCFEQKQLVSVRDKVARTLINSISTDGEPESRKLSRTSHRIRLTSHGLDSTQSCRRRFWLSEKSGWRGERLNFVPTEAEAGYWPEATVFGSLYHRMLEIGLANPGSNVHDLEPVWTQMHEDRLTQSDAIDEVMNQAIGLNEEVAERTRSRLLHLAKICRDGKLGALCSGAKSDGFIVEGLRTELPFLLTITNHPEELHRSVWTPGGEDFRTTIDRIDSIFDGRADLVLALRDEAGKGWLQVVDAKTTGCLNGFKSGNTLEGTPLQMVVDDNSSYATTPAEEELIAKHRLQLTLYCMALEIGEQVKPEAARRSILPPAILVAASGRMIRMHEEDYLSAKNDLADLVSWMGEVSARGASDKAPPRLPMSHEKTCRSCPFNSGSIKLCGPEGERLGPA